MIYKLLDENKVLICTARKDLFISYIKSQLQKEINEWLKENDDVEDKNDVVRYSRECIESNDIEKIATELNSYWCGYGVEIRI